MSLYLTSCASADPDPNSRLGLIIDWAERHPTNVNAIEMLWLADEWRGAEAKAADLADALSLTATALEGATNTLRKEFPRFAGILDTHLAQARAALARIK